MTKQTTIVQIGILRVKKDLFALPMIDGGVLLVHSTS